ncbi:hypothetical protein TSOC_009626 [Tetrabaena socialis]|uniref:Uncharacterized protein n=1 Tax=Tetrabaena socialis TaxID=47790 RepID=A0A2J7ZVF0_9CHLO|nr:hypothetical protein TSOC_009626 [Tetrabaena socialis]|eukprot:PNH04242.1 hypothetical protein TSOC_009626 [Tetrabaena socialis]
MATGRCARTVGRLKVHEECGSVLVRLMDVSREGQMEAPASSAPLEALRRPGYCGAAPQLGAKHQAVMGKEPPSLTAIAATLPSAAMALRYTATSVGASPAGRTRPEASQPAPYSATACDGEGRRNGASICQGQSYWSLRQGSKQQNGTQPAVASRGAEAGVTPWRSCLCTRRQNASSSRRSASTATDRNNGACRTSSGAALSAKPDERRLAK